jgi:hypothetical protein
MNNPKSSAGDAVVDLEQPLLANEEPLGPESVVIAAPVAEEVIRVPQAEAAESPTMSENGRWNDGLFNCCAYGCCHPSFVFPCYFPIGKKFECFMNTHESLLVRTREKLSMNVQVAPLLILKYLIRKKTVAIGQVMHRMNLLISGSRGSKAASKSTFLFLCCATAAIYMVGPSTVNLPTNGYYPTETETSIFLHRCFYVSVSCFIYYLIIITRSYVRRRDRIPEGCCIGCEDCCVSVLFPFCTISQLMRHTADYRVYRAVWFSSTGLPSGVGMVEDSASADRSHV